MLKFSPDTFSVTMRTKCAKYMESMRYYSPTKLGHALPPIIRYIGIFTYAFAAVSSPESQAGTKHTYVYSNTQSQQTVLCIPSCMHTTPLSIILVYMSELKLPYVCGNIHI